MKIYKLSGLYNHQNKCFEELEITNKVRNSNISSCLYFTSEELRQKFINKYFDWLKNLDYYQTYKVDGDFYIKQKDGNTRKVIIYDLVDEKSPVLGYLKNPYTYETTGTHGLIMNYVCNVKVNINKTEKVEVDGEVYTKVIKNVEELSGILCLSRKEYNCSYDDFDEYNTGPAQHSFSLNLNEFFVMEEKDV